MILVPAVVISLLGKMEVNHHTIFTNDHFTKNYSSNSFDSLGYLTILQDLYVQTSHTIWKVPAILSWMKKNALAVCEFNEFPKHVVAVIEKRDKNYGGFGIIPLQLQRMIFISDFQSFIPRIPHAGTNIMEYDPLPPLDAIASSYEIERYERLNPPGTTILPETSAIAAFVQSLLPWIHAADLPPGYNIGDGVDVVDGVDVGNLNFGNGGDEDGFEENHDDA